MATRKKVEIGNMSMKVNLGSLRVHLIKLGLRSSNSWNI